MNGTSAATTSLETFEATFPPMYYDSPVKQMVLGVEVASDDSLTATIIAEAPYFKVSATDVCNWVEDSVVSHPPGVLRDLPTNITGSSSAPARLPTTGSTRHLSAPVAT